MKIGDYFFPGFKGSIKDNPDRFFALFAHPYNAPADKRAVVVATDKAGNTRQLPLTYELKNVKYKKSTIALSDSFLQNKVAPLADAGSRQGSPKDLFVAVNKRVRKENEDKITEVTKKTSPQILWKGAFTQLSNSKVEASFADHRTYIYKGKEVDQQTHLGFDLAVTQHVPVVAAAAGTILNASWLGIYGNCVIIDHGLGVQSLYGHLMSFDVKVGDTVTRGQQVGRSDSTGLAGGDHLHFTLLVGGHMVNPVEWWDPHWMTDRVDRKLKEAK